MAMSVDELLKAANELSGSDLDYLAREVLVLRASRELPVGGFDRRALLKLPLAERRRIMEQQAEAALPYYEQDTEWREWLNFDLVGTDG
jgi:hypothetical protein